MSNNIECKLVFTCVCGNEILVAPKTHEGNCINLSLTCKDTSDSEGNINSFIITCVKCQGVTKLEYKNVPIEKEKEDE